MCSVCPSAPMSGFGHAACRSGRKRMLWGKQPVFQKMNPKGEAPFTHVRDCSGKPTALRGLGGGKPDPKGNAPITTHKTAFKHTLKK